MEVVIPLFAFMIGLGVHRRWIRWLMVTDTRSEQMIRFDFMMLDDQLLRKTLWEDAARRDIEQLIRDTQR